MLPEDVQILEFNHYQKSDKVPFIIYTDLECLIEKIDLIDVKRILKIYLRQNEVSIFRQVFQCLQYRK